MGISSSGIFPSLFLKTTFDLFLSGFAVCSGLDFLVISRFFPFPTPPFFFILLTFLPSKNKRVFPLCSLPSFFCFLSFFLIILSLISSSGTNITFSLFFVHLPFCFSWLCSSLWSHLAVLCHGIEVAVGGEGISASNIAVHERSVVETHPQRW